MRMHPIARRYFLCAVLSLLAGAGCSAAPQLDVAIGFDSQVLRNSYAPFRIEVAGLATPVEGTLVVRQTAGLPGDRRAEIVDVVASGTIENGPVLVTLPIEEPLNPVSVELQTTDGRTLAIVEKSLRLGVRQWAFPVMVGRSTGVASAAVIDSSELPLDWWAYDAAQQVWLVEPPISEASLEALGEWTVSGGSLVILTGAAFPLMDSPTLRRLLPLSAPELVAGDDGSYYLSGTLRSAAGVTIARGTHPLLVQMPLGAGTVSLVTTSLQGLSAADLDALGERIPSTSQPPTTERVSAALLRSTDVPRPGYFVPAMAAGAVSLALVGFGVLVERHRSALGALVALALGASVLLGLYANAHKRWVRQYSMITNVSVISTFGINTAFCSFYAVEAHSVLLRQELGSYPVGDLVVNARGAVLDTESEPSGTRFFLQPTERRDLSFHSRPQLDALRFRVDGSTVEVENRTGRTIAHAYLAAAGAVLSLPPIEPGTQRLPVQSGPLSGEARSAYLSLRGILRPIEEWLPIERRSAWLVTVEERPQSADRDAPELERELFITILEAETS